MPFTAATEAAAVSTDADEGEPDTTDEEQPAPTHPATRHTTTEQPTLPAPVVPQPTLTPPPTVVPAVTHEAPDEQEAPSSAKAVVAAEAAPARPTDAQPTSLTPAPHQNAPTTPIAAPSAPVPLAPPTRSVPADVAAAVRQQLTGPLVKVTQGDGEQILVVQVRPENLGPVTVHAHVRDNTVHVELFAPSDAGRDALTQVSADLRADLQQAHTGNTSLNVSSQTAPSADRDGKPRDGSSAEPRTGDRHPTGDTTGQDAQQHQPRGSNRLLDVLA
ncbi:flagellar hook-length control protein FliK [Curtobacterium sp. MCSS17_016]|uniref:flagellar hook-length control protein FliK n=1 Tax=Curtobacterium sp. MCSS17_016 TaxID=2175644 RepID=UPI0011B5DA7F|nr:flagellar hook-length control protein FliK [Curtobacterium sp. MCSS17_016]WIE80908.1 flagellar hook-length control protein FliK [Curtobacterium sp. MCSS17_016]